MPVLDVLGALLVLAALFVAGITVRRHLLQRRGAIDLSLRLHPGRHGRGWVLGVGRYDGDELLWYRVFSFAARPRRSLRRHGLSIAAARRPSGPEALALMAGSIVVCCVGGDGRPVELAMPEAALPGFRAWLEAAPSQPGRT